MSEKRNFNSIDNTTFSKLQRGYLLAFLLIALTIIAAQILIQRHLNSQLDDSRIVNIAGRQRMLSQKLVKEIVFLEDEIDLGTRDSIVRAIKRDLEVFNATHQELKADLNGAKTDGNESNLKRLFTNIDSYHNELITIVTDLYLSSMTEGQIQEGEPRKSKSVKEKIRYLNQLEGKFLIKMDEIVNEYDALSQQKVKDLKRKEYILLVISLSILLLEIMFLFRPISFYIRQVISDLVSTQEELSEKMVKMNDLYVSKENSLRELQGLNYAINNTVLYANLNEDGKVIHLSKKFARIIGYDYDSGNPHIDDLLKLVNNKSNSLTEFIGQKKHAIWTGEIQVENLRKEKLWLELAVVPMNQVKLNQSVLILCTDITKRIESQQELMLLSERRLKKEIDIQKSQASQIVEAQEEERKRIAKDIHDGIGQMLTALKFHLESLDTGDQNHLDQKFDDLKSMLGDLIREVRAVTFSLTPPELKDYGIAVTLNKLANQLSKLTGKNIYFENKSGFAKRFDSLIETNLYRVVQEAVNNALKYADSNYILISISHSSEKLSIVIDDDGKGFDLEATGKLDHELGMGLFFMKERINFINGRIFMNSRIGEGTRITINLDLDSKAVM